MTSIAEQNPFVGPRSIQAGETLYGRAAEVRGLFHRLQARRIVVLHSPSGAGKSSLVNAGLIPRLRAGKFDVWRPIRVNLDPAGLREIPAGTNRYLLSALVSLEEELPAERRRSPEQLAGLDFATYLSTRPRRKGSTNQAVVLLFDQFEEILALAPLAVNEKRAFFRAVGKALEDLNVWALFIIREDHLAALAPYREQIPTQLSNTFRLDLLSRESAREAAEQLARQGGRSFSGAERLVRDLSTLQVQQADGSFAPEQGLYVEPVQLQVVCRRLWEAMPDDDLSIEEHDVAQYADVSKALGSYYADSVRKIARGAVPVERSLRDWVGTKLIVSGIRSQVRQEAGQSSGLDNGLIRELLGSYLVRAEPRAGAHWYELSHDRLIAPVRADNEAWEQAHLHPLQVQARLWEADKRSQALLLNAAALEGAATWANENAQLLTHAEREFLSASRRVRTEEANQRRRQRRFTQTVVAAGALVVVAAISAFVLNRRAEQAQHRAEQADRVARDSQRMWVAADLTDKDVSAFHALLREVESTDTPNWRALVMKAHARGIARQELRGHDGSVSSVALSPDGKQIATASHDHTVRVWNLDGSGEPRVLLGHTEIVRSVAFSHDGKKIASASDDKSVRVWNVDGSPLLELSQHTLEVRAVAFSHDDTKLASASYDKTIRVWNADGTNRDSPVLLEAHEEPVFALAFSPDGKLLASGSRDRRVLVWKADSAGEYRLLAQLEGHSDDVHGVAFSRDGSRLASGSDDGTVRVWTVVGETFEAPRVFHGHLETVRSVAFNHDGTKLASGSDDRTLRIWDLEGDRQPIIAYAHQLPINAVAYSRDGSAIVTGSNDKTVRVWSADGAGWEGVLGGHSGIVRSVAFSPDGKWLATASDDKSVLVWSAGGAGGAHALKGHSEAVNAIAFTPDGKQLVSGSDDRTLSIWNIGQTDQDKPLRSLGTGAGKVKSVAVSRDGRLLAAGCDDGLIRIWHPDAASQQPPLRTLDARGAEVGCVAFSPDGKLLASDSDNGTIRIWDVGATQRNEPLRSLEPQAGKVRSLAFSPDGKLLAAGGEDNSVSVWSVNGPEPFKRSFVRPHEDAVLSVAFSPDSRLLASGSKDHSVRIWPLLGAGEPRLVPGLDVQEFYAVAFSPDGSKLALGDNRHTVRIAAVEPTGASLLETLFKAAPGCISVEHRQRALRESAQDATLRYERCQAEIARRRASLP